MTELTACIDDFLDSNDFSPHTHKALKSDLAKFIKWFESANGERFDPARCPQRPRNRALCDTPGSETCRRPAVPGASQREGRTADAPIGQNAGTAGITVVSCPRNQGYLPRGRKPAHHVAERRAP